MSIPSQDVSAFFPMELVGTVVRGDQRGRSIGFPTANLILAESEAPVPPRGVYAGLADGLPAAINVGFRPTFPGATPGWLIEVHLIDFVGDLYGKRLRVRFVSRLREERRFDGPVALVAQLEQDVRDARAALQGTAPGP